jgi:ABC-type dipeptide/oligopeptide/nickel transport system ATPase component
MEDGVIVEEAPTADFFNAPKMDRTKAFLSMLSSYAQ